MGNCMAVAFRLGLLKSSSTIIPLPKLFFFLAIYLSVPTYSISSYSYLKTSIFAQYSLKTWDYIRFLFSSPSQELLTTILLSSQLPTLAAKALIARTRAKGTLSLMSNLRRPKRDNGAMAPATSLNISPGGLSQEDIGGHDGKLSMEQPCLSRPNRIARRRMGCFAKVPQCASNTSDQEKDTLCRDSS